MSIFLTSDQHFNHNKNFIWGARGFKNVHEMNEALIKQWNNVVSPEDTVYHLGDMFLGREADINSILYQLHGTIYLITGNHDTKARIEHYRNESKIYRVLDSTSITHDGSCLVLSHYPIDIAPHKRHHSQEMYNIHGHVHSTKKFVNGFDLTYNVAVDAQNLKPISVKAALKEIREYYNS